MRANVPSLVSPLLLALALSLPTLASAAVTEDLGTIDFPTSAPPEVEALFERGVLYLHSFEYGDARQAFRDAQTQAPDFAMAYWGEAMTYNHPIWLEEDADSARAALQRLAPSAEARAAKAPTARERAYLHAVEILYGPGDKEARDQAYAEAMHQLMVQQPQDLEAAAFYALALMGTCHQGRDIRTYMRAAAIADGVFAQNPRHPGAAHYLIHATDDPVHAPLGLRAARAYAAIAPAAGHARHMPSHIFLALGMWDAVVASNQSSWDAVAARVTREGWSVERNNYHALLWQHYALLQEGRYREATRLLARMGRDHAQSRSTRTGSHLALMRAAHAVSTGAFTTLPAAPAAVGLRLSAASSIDFTKGLAALAAGELEAVAEAAVAIQARIAEALQGERTRRQATYARVGNVRTAAAEIMALELEALVAERKGDLASALLKANQAASREDEMPAGFGPPVPAKPSRELLGEILLRAGRAEEALAQLERALERTPRRATTLVDLGHAALASGHQARAEASAAILREVWSRADAGVLERAALGGQPTGTMLAGQGDR